MMIGMGLIKLLGIVGFLYILWADVRDHERTKRRSAEKAVKAKEQRLASSRPFGRGRD